MKYIYVCGPTVYSDVHIGNMRPIITFDIFNRALKELGIEFNFIHNITDIDDKIIKKAQEEKTTEKNISTKYEKLYLDLLDQANVIRPHKLPRVTDNIDGIVQYIDKIIKNNNAYEINGNVYFDINSVDGYGKLSNRNLSTMRFEENDIKKHPGDFALWKQTNEGITFDSPWGKGRPGWHTECSYFVSKYTNGSLDIHGGGIDLLFPHHENENIQNLSVHKKDISKEWRHVGHINLEEEKMSKSLGNVVLAKDFFKNNSSDVLRYIFIISSYSAPINLSNELIEQSKKQINKFKKAFIKSQLFDTYKTDIKHEADFIREWKFAEFNKELNKSLKDFNSNPEKNSAAKLSSLLKLVGFNFSLIEITDKDKDMYKKWIEAKKLKNYEEADKIRNLLKDKNIL